ncbi:MAG: hypothetical protein WCD35_15185 [Mycobacteriales bacterium]
MPRTAARLAAGTLALALPLTAAVGCGVEKKRTIKAEFASAQANFENSKATEVTLRLDDSKGSLEKIMTKGKDGMPKAVAEAVLKGSISYTVDPAGDKTLKSMSAGASATDLSKQLEKVNLSVVVRDDKSALAELRLVAGTLYAHVDLAEIGRLAKAGGVSDFDQKLDGSIGSADPAFAKGLADVRAGKWIKLPLTKYLTQLQQLAGSMAPGGIPTPKPGFDGQAFGKKLFTAVKPYVKVTDANDSTSDRVLDVKVKVRPALKAALAVLQTDKDLPFVGMFGRVNAAEIDKNVTDGTAKGTITLKSGHLTQFAVDMESIRTLATDPGSDSVDGGRVVVDVDDSASEVSAPDNVSDFDLGKVLEQFMQGFGSSSSSASAFGGSYQG